MCLIKMWRSNVAATAKAELRPAQSENTYVCLSVAVEILLLREDAWVSSCQLILVRCIPEQHSSR